MARWKPAPVIGGAYSDDAKAWSCQDTVNYIPVMAEREGGRSPSMLRGVPGFGVFADLGTNAPLRGLHNVEGLLLAVSSNKLFKISSRGVVTEIGTIPGVERVSMAHNQIAGGNEVAIANGQSGYVYNTYTGTLAQITDEGFPGAISFDFCDGYILGVEPGRRFAFHSQLAAATDYNTLDRYEAEGSPDKLVGQIVTHREWWLFGERTIEPYTNTGAATGTFQRSSGTVIEIGAASRHAICQMDNSVFWLGDDGVPYKANGYTPQRIGTHAIEQAIARCNIAQAFAFTFEDEGHKVFYLTFPDGHTWGYDAASGEWHRRQSYGLDRWRVNDLVRWNGKWIAGDYSNGKLYQLDWLVQNEAGGVLERRRITGVLSDNQNPVNVNAVALVFDTGATRPIGPGINIAGNLPGGAVGVSGTYQYVVSGGVPPYGAVTITSGSLPPGATMDGKGLVTYTYTTEGTYSWTVGVMDSDENEDSLDDTAVIAPAAALSLKPKVVSWWDFESDLADKARAGNTQTGATTFVDNATSTGKKLAQGTATRATAGNKGFNFYRPGEYGHFALGARLTVSQLNDVTRLLTVGTDSGTAVTGVLQIGINASGKWEATLFNSSDVALITVASTTSAATGTETHVGVNGTWISTNEMTLGLVINGVQETLSATTAVGTTSVNTQYVIGTYEGTGYSPAVSEMFWAHASLNASEWAYLYNTGNKRFYADFGGLSYGTTYDAYLASLMAAKSGGIFNFNARSGTAAANSAPFGSIGDATLTGGASYSNAVDAPAGFGTDYVMHADGVDGRAITDAVFDGSTNCGGELMNTWVYQPSASADESYFMQLTKPGQPQTGQRVLMQGTDATKFKTYYNDFSGNFFRSTVASNAGASAWKMLTWAGFDINYFAPVVNGIVGAKHGSYTVGSADSAGMDLVVGAYYTGANATAAYFSRTCVVADGNFTLPQLCQLYDLGAGLG